MLGFGGQEDVGGVEEAEDFLLGELRLGGEELLGGGAGAWSYRVVWIRWSQAWVMVSW